MFLHKVKRRKRQIASNLTRFQLSKMLLKTSITFIVERKSDKLKIQKTQIEPDAIQNKTEEKLDQKEAI